MDEKKSILVIDDEEFLTKLIRIRLGEKNFIVNRAPNGEDAIQFLRMNAKPDLILLDLIMPKMSGFEFLEAASVDPAFSKIPVIILSNLSQDSDVEKVSRFGVREYFTKAHVSLEQVILAVQKLVGSAVSEVIATNTTQPA